MPYATPFPSIPLIQADHTCCEYYDGCIDLRKEFMTVFSKTVAERTAPGQRQDVEQQGTFRT